MAADDELWEATAYAGEEWGPGWGVKRLDVVGLKLGFASIAGIGVEVDVPGTDGAFS
ncbi:hypothetical protein ACUY3C_07830 [Corynebacterium marquesiae]